ncbi:MAG TPA: trypsin-like peptidase domain-containing protein [Planctomycetota bacterium]|nr:trypsin-like peptidase domain-containing protein [Planctomycetota bacterium]
MSQRSRLLALPFLLAAASAIVTSAQAEDLPILSEIQSRHELVHEQVAPAVVAVQARGAKSGSGLYGTGVVVSPDGLILTSSTVVPNANHTVQVFFPDGRVMDAKVLGIDDATEGCALKVVYEEGEKKQTLPYVEIADSSKVAVGELTYTAGNPFHTISRDGQVAWSVGTLSGVYRITSADDQSRYTGVALETDAAVNPGSDGGPLFDANGRLLGILSLCFCESRWLGTAVPVHLIKQGLATQLRNVPMLDPKTPVAPRVDLTRQQVLPSALVARAVPDALRTACRPASKAIVKLNVKRSDSARDNGDRRVSLVRRLRQRPDCPVTGVCIEAEGYIVTSAFNIEGDVQSVEAVLSDGTTMPATILGRHLGLDVAILKVTHPKGEMLPYIPLASDPSPQIGRFIAILGASEESPVPTHTAGIVSALGRLDGTAVQTDALTNYGNSGGPVIDLRGRLVGIASQVRTQSDWSQQNSGVGFFTLSDKIIASLPDLKASRDIKAPSRPFLGILADSTTEIRGVKLEQVLSGSAAAEAKLQPGDVILAVDGMDTHSWPQLVRVLKAHKPGDTIEIAYQRGNITARTKTTLTARKDVR